MNKIVCFVACISFFVLSISGCGFHIRSYQDVSPALKRLTVTSLSSHGSLKDLLIQTFQGMGVTIEPRANRVLQVKNEFFSSSKNTIGTAEQLNTVTLTYTATIEIQDASGKPRLPDATFTTSTSYLQNANQILGDINTTSSLQQELMRSMVQQIMGYLSSQDVKHALSLDR